MKRMISILLAAVMALSFTACGTKRESAQQVVGKAITAVQEMDWETAQSYWDADAFDAATDIASDDSADSATDEQLEKVLEPMMQNLSYTITGSEEDEQAGTATVSVDITNINMALVMAELVKNAVSDALTYAFMPADQQPTDKELDEKYMADLTALVTADDVETVTTSVDIPLTLVDDQWQISSSEEAADAMMGGLISYVDSMSEQLSDLAE